MITKGSDHWSAQPVHSNASHWSLQSHGHTDQAISIYYCENDDECSLQGCILWYIVLGPLRRHHWASWPLCAAGSGGVAGIFNVSLTFDLS